MSARAARELRPPLAPAAARPLPTHVTAERAILADGAVTTVYAARCSAVRVVRLRRPEPLAGWSARRHVADAIVGGFFTRPGGLPLGELRTRGIVRRHVPFLAPWHADRACVHLERGRVTIGGRRDLPAEPRGDLLQAGPLLVAGGAVVYRDGEDREGFSAGAVQFDSDITATRHPRAALARLADGTLLAVAGDGRAGDEAGLTLGELATWLAERGAVAALNLDGGGSTSLVCGGRLVNRPREGDGSPIPTGRPVSTAIVLEPKR